MCSVRSALSVVDHQKVFLTEQNNGHFWHLLTADQFEIYQGAGLYSLWEIMEQEGRSVSLWQSHDLIKFIRFRMVSQLKTIIDLYQESNK